MQESAVWQALRRECGNEVRIRRVENRLEVGFPDTLWTYRGKTGLFELKDWEGSDWVSKEQALWMRDWASFGGICGVLAKKTRREWLWYPASASFEWLRAIQNKLGVAPSLTISCITSAFFDTITASDLEKGQIRDPRKEERQSV